MCNKFVTVDHPYVSCLDTNISSAEGSAYYLLSSGLKKDFSSLAFSSASNSIYPIQGAADFSALWLFDYSTNSSSEGSAYYLLSSGLKNDFSPLAFSRESYYINFMQGAADYSALWLFDTGTNSSSEGSAHYLSSSGSQKDFSSLAFSNAFGSINSKQGAADYSALWLFDASANSASEGSAYYLLSSGSKIDLAPLLFLRPVV